MLPPGRDNDLPANNMGIVTYRPIILIGSTILVCWLGVQAVHELGHVLGAWSTGGDVSRVVLHPLTISRTDLSHNPRPGVVVWAGPVVGVVLPTILWQIANVLRMPATFVLRFFAGFCLLANGLYIGLGSFASVGDCGEMLRHGASMWQLWLFGLATAPMGLLLWHGQGKHFGIGPTAEPIDSRVVIGTFLAAVALLILGLSTGR